MTMRKFFTTINHPLASACVGACLLAINISFAHNPLIGYSGLLFYVIGFGFGIGHLFSTFNTAVERFFWGCLSLFALQLILNTSIYYLFAITPLTMVISLIIPFLCFLFPSTEMHPPPYKTFLETVKKYIHTNSCPRFLTILFLVTEFVLYFVLIQHRTDGLLPSPWTPLKPWFFLLFAVATVLLFGAVAKSRNVVHQILLSAIHFFLVSGVAVIIYKLGFGFDAFVHRATEVYIQQHGVILPKTPYYLGQYTIVNWLSSMTSSTIFAVDVALVPVLASLTLPAGVAFSLKRIWQIPLSSGFLLVWIIPFLPFLTLNLTTPHNLVLLFSLLIVFGTLAYVKNKFPLSILLLLSIASLMTHPLIATPMALFVLSAIVVQWKRSSTLTYLSQGVILIMIAVIIPVLFALLAWTQGNPLPTIGNPFLKIPELFQLFARPYWYAKTSPLPFELVYTWHRLIPVVVIILGAIGWFGMKKDTRVTTPIYIGCAGFILSAWLLRSWVVFADVISYEQIDFPLRLLKTSLFFVLPFAMVALFRIATKFHLFSNRNKLYTASFAIIFALFFMLSLYLSYPQRNPKARFPGLNVTQADFDAVEWIHNQNEPKNNDYIVLANQLVSAASITKYGFAKHFDTPVGELFYYSIPTGGLLYEQYGKMLYQGQKREFMESAMNLVDVNTAYFVLNQYWANSDDIAESAKKTADSWYQIDDRSVWIFQYTK